MLRFRKILYAFAVSLFFAGCASVRTNNEFYMPVTKDLINGDYAAAGLKIEQAEKDGIYAEKDRVLLYLDRGIILHYKEKFAESNAEFDKAEKAMEELYTKSVSKAVGSMLLNDNALDYSGEVYENLYVNIFKGLNYLSLKKYDDAYVEVNRVNNKLKELRHYYDDLTAKMNDTDDLKIKMKPKELDYLDNVLSHYISYLIYRGEGRYDDCRISLKKLNDAWNTYPDVYYFRKPEFIDSVASGNESLLNVMAFIGPGPVKEAVGARISTFDNYIMISDPTNFHADGIPFPGIGGGYNFKFSFPRMILPPSYIKNIEVYSDSVYLGRLDLLEDIGRVAEKTFESSKAITYFKTAARAVLKGLSANKIGRKLQGDNNSFIGDLILLLTNAAVDITENADLRLWRTTPGFCYAGEFPVTEGEHNIEVRFVDLEGRVLSIQSVKNYKITRGLNLLEAINLN